MSQTLAEFNQTVTEDPTTGVKIVSFGMNPSMLSIEARLKECLAENESLKEKIRNLEENTLVGIPNDGDLLQEKQSKLPFMRIRWGNQWNFETNYSFI